MRLLIITPDNTAQALASAVERAATKINPGVRIPLILQGSKLREISIMGAPPAHNPKNHASSITAEALLFLGAVGMTPVNHRSCGSPFDITEFQFAGEKGEIHVDVAALRRHATFTLWSLLAEFETLVLPLSLVPSFALTDITAMAENSDVPLTVLIPRSNDTVPRSADWAVFGQVKSSSPGARQFERLDIPRSFGFTTLARILQSVRDFLSESDLYLEAASMMSTGSPMPCRFLIYDWSEEPVKALGTAMSSYTSGWNKFVGLDHSIWGGKAENCYSFRETFLRSGVRYWPAADLELSTGILAMGGFFKATVDYSMARHLTSNPKGFGMIESPFGLNVSLSDQIHHSVGYHGSWAWRLRLEAVAPGFITCVESARLIATFDACYTSVLRTGAGEIAPRRISRATAPNLHALTRFAGFLNRLYTAKAVELMKAAMMTLEIRVSLNGDYSEFEVPLDQSFAHTEITPIEAAILNGEPRDPSELWTASTLPESGVLESEIFELCAALSKVDGCGIDDLDMDIQVNFVVLPPKDETDGSSVPGLERSTVEANDMLIDYLLGMPILTTVLARVEKTSSMRAGKPGPALLMGSNAANEVIGSRQTSLTFGLQVVTEGSATDDDRWDLLESWSYESYRPKDVESLDGISFDVEGELASLKQQMQLHREKAEAESKTQSHTTSKPASSNEQPAKAKDAKVDAGAAAPLTENLGDKLTAAKAPTTTRRPPGRG